MKQTMLNLQSHKDELIKKLEGIGSFRRGNISVNFSKCGKANCVCSQPGHAGHGPRYLWSTTIKGRSYTKNLKLGVELQKYKEEIDNYHIFQRVCDEIILTSEKICELQPISEVEDGDELEGLKKKLQQYFLKKYKKRLRK